MIPHDLNDFFGGQQVFVTGASGFIGSHVASFLVQTGARVRAFARSPKGRHDPAIEFVGNRDQVRRRHADQVRFEVADELDLDRPVLPSTHRARGEDAAARVHERVPADRPEEGRGGSARHVAAGGAGTAVRVVAAEKVDRQDEVLVAAIGRQVTRGLAARPQQPLDHFPM